MKSISDKYCKALESLGTEQNRKIYKRHGASDNLFGVSFANLKKLVKEFKREIGKSADTNEIAFELWKSNNTDAMTFAAMIMDPSRISYNDIFNAANDVTYQIVGDELAKVIAKSPLAVEIIDKFTMSNDEYVKRMGFVTLSQIVLTRKSEQVDIPKYIKQIENEIQTSSNRAKEGMNNCLIVLSGIEDYAELAIEATNRIGKVEIDHGNTSCKTYDAAKEIIRTKENKLKKF